MGTLNKKLLNFYIEVMSSRLLNSIEQRCNNPKRSDYINYGAKGIKCLLTRQDIKFLLKRDKAWLLKLPTIDRIKVKKDYTLDNCQFIEKSENCRKDKFKPILQFSLDGILIKEFKSLQEASKCTGNSSQNISYCASGKCKTSAGYIWKYK